MPLSVEDRGSARHTRARRLVAGSGVPEATMVAAETHGPVDWRALAAAMDTMFLSAGSQLAQRRFWFTRHLTLGGLSPLEALERPGGSQAVTALARKFRGAR
jgi:hypothetical protein